VKSFVTDVRTVFAVAAVPLSRLVKAPPPMGLPLIAMGIYVSL